MIPIKETSPGIFEPIVGNPTLLSLDGKVKAPLLTILHASWSAEDRARFGVHLVEPAAIPEGKQAAGAPAYEMRDGAVVEVIKLEDIPPPQPGRYELLKAEVEALAARVATLEGKA
jgi:hypothetical protein